MPDPLAMTPDVVELAEALKEQYAFEGEIGRGGMGVVYRARDLKLDRPVAIKVLPPYFERDPAIRERFLREARTAGSLSHANIVPVYRADELGGHVFFAMAYVDGESLGTRLVDGRTIPHPALVPLLVDVARALDYAHARKVIHRDVKPENILIEGTTGRAMLTDFGIARVAATGAMTATGQVLGTVWYMSPEQVMGEPLDGRSDLYALGVVAFRALSGRFPFDSEVPAAILVAHATRPAPPLSSVAPRVPAALAAIVDKCLSKTPAARYRTGAELADALEATSREPVEDAAPLPATLSETNAQALWRRAAELQSQTGRESRPPIATSSRPLPTGYAMRDVLSAAAEAGIGDEYMARAAAELGFVSGPIASPGTALTSSFENRPRFCWFGRPREIAIEAVVPREVPDAEVDAVAEYIRHVLRVKGSATRFGRALTWTSRSVNRRIDVTITTRGGKTIIRADEHLDTLAGGLFGGIGGGMGGGGTGVAIAVGVGALHSPEAALGIALAFVASSYGLARTIFTTSAESRERELRRLVERIAEQFR
ncbi:MAG TPA: serine/threonine-protein kinase [Gemmatimonadaceae bacterium]|jgi:serine/threonine protein kinase|nr:serine/threonine-protein kinase [Gemmatimonadaceae bacterium]